jgi:uncharacterized membrane protein YfcA
VESVPVLWLPLGCVVGLWSGLSGYSVWPLVVPFLLVAHVPLYETLALCLAVDAANAVGAGSVYLARGDGDARLGVRLALPAVPAALAGAGVSFLVLESLGHLLRDASGGVAVVLGLLLLVRAFRLPRQGAGAPVPATWEAISSQRTRRLARLGAGAIAFLVGLIGMGGGFQMTLIGIFLLGFAARRALATALVFSAAIIPVALLAYLVFLRFSLPSLPALVPFAAGSALGAMLDARFAGRLPERGLGIAMGACVTSAGVAAIVQRWALG